MSAPVFVAASVTGRAPNVDQVMSTWYQRYYCGALTGLFRGLSAPSAERVQICMDTRTRPFFPLPFAEQGIILLGQREGDNLIVVFYNLTARVFLPIYVKLSYTERTHLAGRDRKNYVKMLVTAARYSRVPDSNQPTAGP